MSERIRYRKVNDIQVESIQEFEHPTNGAKYKVIITTAQTQPGSLSCFEIFEIGSNLIVNRGGYAKLPALQKEVRTALDKLGILLSKGTRSRKVSALELASTR
jgi:hypothetical protein